jgi:dTDP-4-amino-4,6-dideoxygalactose transaminase
VETKIVFNKPYLTGKEIDYISEAHERGLLAGDGHFTRLCSSWLEKNTGCKKALLTHSCTAALEMAALLADIQPGDEVIMSSYTFVSTANAFVLRGGVPVFVDIRADTLNIDESKIEAAITPKTKAIVPMHYGGVGCDMDTIMNIAKKYRLLVIEDAAQSLMASYKTRSLGTIGDLGCFSFHETKNIISGEGGALLINNPELVERAEIIREKGTNRSKFLRGQIDKYSWVDIGSSYLPGEIVAAFLWAQLQEADFITQGRLAVWDKYHSALDSLENKGKLRRPVIPVDCVSNGHLYYLLLRDADDRNSFLEGMQALGIDCVFHYMPLHSSLSGRKYGRISDEVGLTDDLHNRLVRLPMWLGVDVNKVTESIYKIYPIR